jgi:hypothetical protein
VTTFRSDKAQAFHSRESGLTVASPILFSAGAPAPTTTRHAQLDTQRDTAARAGIALAERSSCESEASESAPPLLPSRPPRASPGEHGEARHERAAAARDASAAGDRARRVRLLRRPPNSQGGRGCVEAARPGGGGGGDDDGSSGERDGARGRSPGRRGGARRVQEAGAAGLQPAAQLGSIEDAQVFRSRFSFHFFFSRSITHGDRCSPVTVIS